MMTSVVCEWGLTGIEAWRARASVFIIVDVLSFSTAVSIAVDRGASIIPFGSSNSAAARFEADRRGAIVASAKRTLGGQFSLSPSSLREIHPGSALLLPSPNGARLSLSTGNVPTICGALRNCSVVAARARKIASGGLIVVIPAGEQWPDSSLRPSVEDFIGAGAIISSLRARESSEATVARLAFERAMADIQSLIRNSISGKELTDRGFAQDIEIALEVGGGLSVPILVDGAYVGN